MVTTVRVSTARDLTGPDMIVRVSTVKGMMPKDTIIVDMTDKGSITMVMIETA